MPFFTNQGKMNFNTLGLPLRNTVLTLVFLLSVIVNIIFCAATLSDPLSLYTLAAYLVVLGALGLQLENTQLADGDAKDTRLRTPLRVSFFAYVLVWLAWWFISQMFFDAGVVFAQGYIVLVILVPLIFLQYSYDVPLNLPPKYRRFVVYALLFVTGLALFFPTFGWAPQHVNAWQPALRVLLYFLSILTHAFNVPLSAHIALPSGTSPRSSKPLQQVLTEDPNDDPNDVEMGDIQERRRIKLQSDIDARERIEEEVQRTREFIAESAWILVTPLAVVLLLFPIVILALMRNSARRRHVIHQQSVLSEEIKVHSPPPPIPAPVVQPVRAPHFTMPAPYDHRVQPPPPPRFTFNTNTAQPAVQTPPPSPVVAQPPAVVVQRQSAAAPSTALKIVYY